MNRKQLKSLGIVLGILVVVMVVVRFSYSWKAGTTNWYYVVMICGMLLLLFNTLVKPRGRK